MTRPLDELRLLAEAQHGLVRRRDTSELGIDRSRLYRRIQAGEWDVLPGGVLRLRGAPRTRAQAALAAVLAAGPAAALSNRAAAAWWGVPGFDLMPPIVTVPRTRRSASPVLVRTTEVWPDWHRTVDRGVAVTTPARTIVDLAGVIHPGRLERALDTMWARRLLSGEEVRMVLDEVAGRGRRGVATVRDLLAARGPTYAPPESHNERRLGQILEQAGEPPFERQVIIADDDGPIGRVDLLDPDLWLIVEVDSERFHASVLDRRNDAARDARLIAAGYDLLRIGEREIWTAPARALARVRAARRAARHRRAA